MIRAVSLWDPALLCEQTGHFPSRLGLVISWFPGPSPSSRAGAWGLRPFKSGSLTSCQPDSFGTLENFPTKSSLLQKPVAGRRFQFGSLIFVPL